MIGLAWLASSTWVLPVLTWHHVEFGGVRQNEVSDLRANRQGHLKNTLKEEKNKQRKGESIHSTYMYVFCFRATFVKQNLQALDRHSFSSDELYLKVQSVF